MTNPATGEEIQTYESMTDKQVGEILDRVDAAHRDWRCTSMEHRAGLLRRAAEVLRGRAQPYAERMAREMGKPVRDGRSEIEKCAWVCEYYAEHGADFLADEPLDSGASESFVHYEPLGVVLAVMPWNFPFWQVFRFAAPGLMAGNGAVLKHASNVPGSALGIEEVFRDAGFPADLFRTLLISSDQVQAVLESDRVQAATLTGSGPAGSAVAKTAGAAIKKTVLELGGSDPYLILEDADLDLAAEQCATSRLINSGQSCIAAKRFVVVDAIYDEFLDRFLEQVGLKRLGDPLDETTDIGPQAREDLRDDLHQQVVDSIEAGARCVLGGEVPDGPGAFYPATVLVDVTPGMPAYDDELFGPVASVIRARDEADAIRIANDSRFGLGAAVFTRDVERGRRIAASALEAGCCFVNAYVQSDPRLPFGGIKTSGYGRELSHYGIREFVNVKTVSVA